MMKTFVTLMLSVALVGWIATGAAWAGNCGATACSCGDNVTADRTLQTTDPIVGSVCPDDGLIMNTPNVKLNLNGLTLIGSGVGVGVKIAADGVTVKNGGVDQFETGIGTDGPRMRVKIQSIRPNLNAGDGIHLQSGATAPAEGNELSGILAKRNGNNGVTVIGDFNVLDTHNDEYNGFHGVSVQGNDSHLIAVGASENRKKGPGDGIHVVGDRNTIERSRISKMNTRGIVVDGHDNTLIANLVRKQDTHGIIVEGDNNVLTNNRAIANKGRGILVTGNGDAGDSAENVVSKNRVEPQCSIYGVTTPDTCVQK